MPQDIKTQYILVGRDQTKRALGGFQRNVAKAQRAVSGLGVAFGGLVGTQTIRSVLNAGVALERIERGLRAATGSASAAASELAFIRSEANRLGLNLETAAQSYTRFAAATRETNLEGQATRDIFTAVSEAATVLGLSADQTQGALTALEQIVSKGRVSAEELRGQLGERLPGAFRLAAQSIGKTTSELDDLLKAGELTAEELLPNLATELRKTFGPEVEEATQSAQAAFERLNTAVFTLQTSVANSGIVDFFTDLANASSTALQAFGTGDPLDDLNRQIQSIRNSVAELERLGVDDDIIDEERRALAVREQLYVNLLANQRAEQANREKSLALAKKETAEAEKVIRLIPELTTVLLRPRTPVLIEQIQEFTKEIEKAEVAVQDFGFVFSSSLENALVNGEGVRNVLQGILQDIIRIAARIAITQPLGGAIGGFVGNIFGGGRASGGPVRQGVAYTVGEKGPETFVPSVSGTIVPSGGMMGGVTIVNNINATGADSEVRRALPGLLEQNREATINSIIQLRNEGRF
jgi:tape measure domain-containing protein